MDDDKSSSSQYWGPEGKDYFFAGLGALGTKHSKCLYLLSNKLGK